MQFKPEDEEPGEELTNPLPGEHGELQQQEWRTPLNASVHTFSEMDN